MTPDTICTAETLDPPDWDQARALAHRMVDDAIDHLRDVRDRPVWQSIPGKVRAAFSTPVPHQSQTLADVYAEVSANLTPYPMGNVHPRFWMWYMGTSNFTGALADFLAAIDGSNLGAGNTAASLIDRQTTD